MATANSFLTIFTFIHVLCRTASSIFNMVCVCISINFTTTVELSSFLNGKEGRVDRNGKIDKKRERSLEKEEPEQSTTVAY